MDYRTLDVKLILWMMRKSVKVREGRDIEMVMETA